LIFSHAVINFLLHSTENHDLVVSTISNTFGIPEEHFKTQKIMGHFGNPIASLTIDLNSAEIYDMFSNISKLLTLGDKKSIVETFKTQINDKNFLYIRFGKQELFENKLTVCYSDSLRIKLKYKSNDKLILIDEFEKLLMVN
tara:strand:- start:229 stop:654 length:426 start_codon:yes stop_codon:yes gene_type:complete